MLAESSLGSPWRGQRRRSAQNPSYFFYTFDARGIQAPFRQLPT